MRRYRARHFALVCAILVAGAATRPLAAQAPDRARLEAAVDSLAAAELRSGPTAGLSVAVVKNGQTLLAKGYGFAELEHDVPATARTVYRIGSITKQFTAAAVMQLVEQGKIGLEDDVTKYLPDFPMQGRRVTIHHLLTHTSGIRSYTGLGPKWTRTLPLELSHEELLALFKDEPFDFEPGEDYRYNNSGYYLLGMILEKVTGQRYGDYVRDRLARPLGLEATLYCDEQPLVKHRAQGYARSAGALVNDAAIGMSQPFAAGALCSTVGDLVRWTEALHAGRVVGAASLQRMTTRTTLNSGRSMPYGYGLQLGEVSGRRAVRHGGGVNGFVTDLLHLPGDGLTVVVLTNTEGTQPDRLADRIARLALGIPEPEIKALALRPEELARYLGTYDLGPLQIRVFEREGRLMAQGTDQPELALLAQGDHAFVVEPYPRIRIVFKVEGARAVALMLHQGGAITEARRIQ